MILKILIADDDAGMRLVLRKIIESMDGMECVGEAADGAEAVRLCKELNPDMVFLDVDMPAMTGVEAAKEIAEALPNIVKVFCTAHSQYMPDAFDLYAADYLIKPFKTDRVRQTLRRVQKANIKSKTAPPKTIMLKNREGMTFLPVKDILLVFRENKLTYIETAEGSYTTSESLSSLWAKLDGGDFFRCHRAYIINVTAIANIHPYGRWTYTVSLRGADKTALITQEKLDELQATLQM
ncbi:MAG: LytTR family DNA-binding domain-containing protein [Oscillospiraceae bacterium]|nr:LytTR family DNA-binding domain-containing protein [Oscillospiraceae bacterium]